jgi:acetyltransferase-like isoleucine patch superfamily enzyme
MNATAATKTSFFSKLKKLTWHKVRIRLSGVVFFVLNCHRIKFQSPPVINGRFPNINARGQVFLGRSCFFLSLQSRQQIDALKGATIEIGDGSFLNEGVNICASIKVTIGDYAKIGNNVCIIDTDFHPVAPTTPVRKQAVAIGKNVWIGANCIILAGVTIGDHSVIAAGSVVTGALPSKCVAAGVPARVVKTFEAPDDWVRP